MATEAAAESALGTYVYAIVRGETPQEYGKIGLEEADVRRIGDAELSALVSSIRRGRVRPERRHLSAHNAVLKSALCEQAILPLTFGMIASSDQSVRRLLSQNRKLLREQLDQVEGKIEMGLRVTWDVPNVFEYFLSRHTELRESRDAIGDFQRARHSDMVGLGQLFEQIQRQERERLTESVSAVLVAHGVQVKAAPSRSEREVMNLSCLVSKPQQAAFEAMVSESASSFDSSYLFDISGPWAPHHFVELSLTMS